MRKRYLMNAIMTAIFVLIPMWRMMETYSIGILDEILLSVSFFIVFWLGRVFERIVSPVSPWE